MSRHSHHPLSAAHESFFCLFNQYFLLYIVCEGRYSFFIKKKFLFRCPHTLTIRLKRPVYRGFSGEGKCEGVRVNRMKNWKLAFPSAVECCFFILHSHCCLALCEPAATELKSKNAHGSHRFFRSLLHGSVFLIYFFLIYILIYLLILIVPWQDKRDFRRIFLLIVP